MNGSLDDAAVRCFTDVAKVVGVKTVAEFVEKPVVRERLREIGVDYAQGSRTIRAVSLHVAPCTMRQGTSGFTDRWIVTANGRPATGPFAWRRARHGRGVGP